MATFSHHGKFAKTAFRCHNCFSTEYYEDEQGDYNCAYCHMQSQDFIAESHEADEGVAFTTIRRLTTPRALSAKWKQNALKITNNPELYAFLQLYQYVLQMLMNCTMEIIFLQEISVEDGVMKMDDNPVNVASNTAKTSSKTSNNKQPPAGKSFTQPSSSTPYFASMSSSSVPSSQPSATSRPPLQQQYQHELKQRFMASLKTLWLQYLQKWKTTTATCKMSQAFCSTANIDVPICSCKIGDYKHPLFPTKPLLLSFLYLTLRQYRLDITIYDIVRWCEKGLLPYNNLWEVIPKVQKERIPFAYRYIFTPQHVGALKMITPANLWYHTTSLAESLELPIPSLNTVLVAYSMICTLISNQLLANLVFIQYCKLSQVFTTGQALELCMTMNQTFVEPIMSTIMVAYMMCPEWQTWTACQSRPIATFNSIKEYQFKLATSSNSAATTSPFISATLSSIPKPSLASTHSAIGVHQALRRANLPTSLSELQEIPRYQLGAFLSQIRDNLTYFRISRHMPLVGSNFKFNRSVLEFFSSVQFQPIDPTLKYIKKTKNHQDNPDPDNEVQESRFALGQALIGSFQQMNELTFNPKPSSFAHIPSKHIVSYDSSMRMNHISWYHGGVFEDQLTNQEKAYDSKLNYSHRRLPKRTSLNSLRRSENKAEEMIQSNDNDDEITANGDDDDLSVLSSKSMQKYSQRIHGKVVYFSHARHSQDVTGLRPMSYTVLLERFAKYLYISPMVIHSMVDQIDHQIAEFVFRGKVSKEQQSQMASLEANRAMLQKLEQQRLQEDSSRNYTKQAYQEELKRYAKYRRKSKALMPLIREVALSGLLPNFHEVDTLEDEHEEKENDGDEESHSQKSTKHQRKKLKPECINKLWEKRDVTPQEIVNPHTSNRSYWKEINELLDVSNKDSEDSGEDEPNHEEGEAENRSQLMDIDDGLVGKRTAESEMSDSSTLDDSSDISLLEMAPTRTLPLALPFPVSTQTSHEETGILRSALKKPRSLDNDGEGPFEKDNKVRGSTLERGEHDSQEYDDDADGDDEMDDDNENTAILVPSKSKQRKKVTFG